MFEMQELHCVSALTRITYWPIPFPPGINNFRDIPAGSDFEREEMGKSK